MPMYITRIMGNHSITEKIGQREQPRIRQPLEEDTSTDSISPTYLRAAQRLVTLEQRLYIPQPMPTGPLTSVEQQLQIYLSPERHRPSPASLPSKAKYYIRGPSRRAPPNTPEDVDCGELAGQEVKPEVTEQNGGVLDPVSCEPESKDGRAWIQEAYGLQVEWDDQNDGGASSGYSTPCPTPTDQRRSWNPDDHSERDLGPNRQSTQYSETNDIGPENVEGHSTSFDPLHSDTFRPKGTSHRRRAYDLSTLEGIASEIGAEITLGYEIRHFAWNKCRSCV